MSKKILWTVCWLALACNTSRAAIITGATATASSTINWLNRPPQAAVNGSGLELGGDNSALTADQRSISNNGDVNNWLSRGIGAPATGFAAQPDNDPWFLVDLGATYRVGGVRVFNYPEHGAGGDATNRGIRHVDVLVSTDGVNYTTLASNFEIAKAIAPLANAFNDFGTYYSISDFTGGNQQTKLFRYFMFDIHSNWGDLYTDSQGNTARNYGLAELQFQEVEIPEPSTWLLLACGLVGVVASRARWRN